MSGSGRQGSGLEGVLAWREGSPTVVTTHRAALSSCEKHSEAGAPWWADNLAPEHMGTSLGTSRNTLQGMRGCGMVQGAGGLCEQRDKNGKFGLML